jgi:RecJ-like exonuclease
MGGIMNFDGSRQMCFACQGTGVCPMCHGAHAAPRTRNGNSGNNTPRQDTTCSFCHGTGTNPNPSYAPTYGTEQGEKYCSICERNVSENHYHTSCPMCRGTGHRN